MAGRRLLGRLAVLCVVGLAMGAGVVLAPWPAFLATLAGPDPGRLAPPVDPVFLDRDGAPLVHGVGPSGTRGEWTGLDRIPLLLVQAFLAAEDGRFHSHHGFDPLAIARAAKDDLSCRRIVSGASTITQQTVRLIEPRPRTIAGKIVELVKAVALEKTLTKSAILEQYLNRVPMPGNRRGVTAGARLLFDRDVGALTIAECALLASLPQSPGRLDPRRPAAGQGLSRLEKRRRWVLERMVALGYLTPAQRDQAVTQQPAITPGRFPFLAPHLMTRLSRRLMASGPVEVRTTLDRRIQELAERTVDSHRVRLLAKGASQAAVVVLDNSSREVLAWVGSLGWQAGGLGYNDGVIARRSAGSTLKPFVYALALERGMSLGDCLPDVRRTFATPRGDYDPRNFNRHEYGPVSLRTALGSSLNTAAVDLARRVGVLRIGDFLAALELLERPRAVQDLGLGIVIGNVEVSLVDLAAAYATLATGGLHAPATALRGDRRPAARRLLAADTAHLVLDALSDPAARVLTFGNARSLDFPFPVALKTGTSTSYRDTWAVACTPVYTVAAWAGNFNGTPTSGLSGATGAAPIMRDILLALHAHAPPPPFERPAGVVTHEVCADSGGSPGPACPARSRELFLSRLPLPPPCAMHRPDQPNTTLLSPAYATWIADRELRGVRGRHRLDPASTREQGLEIAYPHAGDRFILPRGRSEEPSIVCRAIPRQNLPFVRWFLDGTEVASTPPPYRWSWTLAKGHHTLLAASPDLTGASVVRIQVE